MCQEAVVTIHVFVSLNFKLFSIFPGYMPPDRSGTPILRLKFRFMNTWPSHPGSVIVRSCADKSMGFPYPRDLSSLVRAFKVYVRPVVEYCSVVWNAHYMKDFVALERVQRRFTKRLHGMKAQFTYHQRLVKLRLESLEFRRIRLDLVFA